MKSDFTTAPHALALDKGAASGAVEKSTRALHTKNLIPPKSTLWDYDLGNPGAKAPNGMLAHKWDFAYTPKEPRDLITIANKIKMNNLAIRVSYWLDNVDVVYFGKKQIDQTPIQQFEQCINDNHIFDTPL